MWTKLLETFDAILLGIGLVRVGKLDEAERDLELAWGEIVQRIPETLHRGFVS